MKRRLFLISIGIFFLIADQAIKIFLVSFLSPTKSIPIIKNVFSITLIFNRGCAFGLFKNQSDFVFCTVSFSAVIFLIYFLKRLKGSHTFSRIAAILIISGAVSNFIDRLRLGYVIDFLDFHIWPVFNLGDTAITLGVLILILQILIKSKN